jgi:hypothetical protein
MRLAWLLMIGIIAASATPAPAGAQTLSYIEGYALRLSDRSPIANVCVTLGQPVTCTTATDAAGYYRINEVPTSDDFRWEIFFSKEGFRQERVGLFRVQGPTRVDVLMTPGPGLCARPSTPNTTIYLPNVTKTFGGLAGWQTPFIVQNASRFIVTSLSMDFFRFSDGLLMASRDICAVRPGMSFADIPNNDAELPNDTQFSVVVKSYMTDVVAVVNEHQATGARAEAASYIGASRGATSVFLPNIVKTFNGFVTPFIIQNLGTVTTTASASFISFGGAHTATLARTIAPGRSQFIDPNAEPALRDGTQYAVTVTATQPISVVVNTHNDAPSVPRPVVYSTNGMVEGASPLLGPYAVKGMPGVGKGISTIVVQNLGTGATAPTLSFQPLGGGIQTVFTGPSIDPRASWAFDPRFVDGDPAKGICASFATAGCLADGEYAFVGRAENDSIAAVVNVIGDATAAGYSAVLNGAARVFLPNVTRRLGGASGWTTPLAIEGNTATGATLSWYRFSDGGLVTTQTISLGAGVSRVVDPRDVPGLIDDAQYSVVAEGTGGTIGAIVMELNFSGGDGAMTYEGFLR